MKLTFFLKLATGLAVARKAEIADSFGSGLHGIYNNWRMYDG